MVEKISDIIKKVLEGDDVRDAVLGTVTAEVTVSVPILGGGHQEVRLERPGYEAIEEAEILEAVQRAGGKILKIYMEEGSKHFAIINTQNNLNVILEVRGGGGKSQVRFKIVTVMKKKGFVPKAGTRKVII